MSGTSRLLEVDLTAGKWQSVPLDDSRLATDPGGGALGARLLLDTTSTGLSPFDREMPLMMLSSVVAGQPAVGLARCTMMAKSPLTGGVGESRVEGAFGVALGRSSYIGVVIRGRAQVATALVLDGERVLFEPVPELWGSDTGTATTLLAGRFGHGSSVAVIGPAGERLVRYASIVCDYTHTAARMGMGAVMGSKLLKAVVITPQSNGREPTCAEAMQSLTSRFRSRAPEVEQSALQLRPPGFGAWPLGDVPAGYVNARNCRTNVLPPLTVTTDGATRRARTQDLVARMTASAGACPACLADCIKSFENRIDRRAGGLDEEALAAFALNLGVPDLDDCLEFVAQCRLLGVDPVSFSATVSFLCELGGDFEWPEPHASEHVLRFGDAGVIRKLLADCVLRCDGSEWLGEGVRQASATLGPDTEFAAMHVKGLELSCFELRASAGQALATAISPIGPRYDIVEHDIDFDPIDGMPEAIRQLAGIAGLGTSAMARLDGSRVERTALLMAMWSGLDTLGLCLFAGPPSRAFDLDDECALVEAITGWQCSPAQILAWGKRRLGSMHEYNSREGIVDAADTLPNRFFEQPIDHGRHAGARLDRDLMTAAVDRCRFALGWQASASVDASLRPRTDSKEQTR